MFPRIFAVSVALLALCVHPAKADKAAACETAFTPYKSSAEINRLVKSVYPFMMQQVNQYAEYAALFGVSRDQLISAGNDALIRAAEKYDPRRSKFTTYSRWWMRSYFGKLIARAKTQTGNELSLDQNVGVDSGKGKTFHEVVAGSDYEDTLPELDFADREEREVFEIKAHRFRRRLNDSERIVFDNRFYSLRGEPRKTLDETGKLLGVSGERVRHIEVKLRPLVEKFFAAAEGDNALSFPELRSRLGFFKRSLTPLELLIVEQRLTTWSPLTLEELARRANTLPSFIRRLETRLRAQMLYHDQALEVFERRLPEQEKTILAARILSDSVSESKLAAELKMSKAAVHGVVEKLQIKLKTYLPVLQDLIEKRVDVTAETVALALKERGIDKAVSDVRRSIGLAQGNRWSRYPDGFAFVRDRLDPANRTILEEYILEPLSGPEELGNKLGLSVSHQLIKRRHDIEARFDRYAGLVQKLLDDGLPVNARNLQKVLRDEGTRLGLLEIGNALRINPLGGFEAGTERFIENVSFEEKLILEAVVLAPEPKTVKEAAAATGLRSDYINHNIGPLRQEALLYVPALQRAIEAELELTPETIYSMIEREAGVPDEVSPRVVAARFGRLRLEQSGEALAELSRHLKPRESEFLELRILSNSTSTDALASRFAVSKIVVERSVTALRGKLEMYLPVFEELLAEAREVTPDSVSAALRKQGVEKSAERVAEELRFGPGRRYSDSSEALAFVRKGLKPMHQALLDHRLITETPLSRKQFGERFGVNHRGLDQIERALEHKLQVYIPAIELLRGENAELTPENISSALARAGDGGHRRTPTQVRLDLGLTDFDPVEQFKTADFAGPVTRFAALFDENWRKVLYRRILAAQPESLPMVANELGISKSRVHQMDESLRELLVKCVPAIAKLQAEGKEVTVDGIAEVLNFTGTELAGFRRRLSRAAE